MTPRLHRNRRRGYTLIEVMMSMAVLSIGGLGIMALQQATTRGTRDAREMSHATQITARWLDRLRQDSLQWTTAGAAGVAATTYLQNAPAGELTAGDWFTPGPAVAGRSYGANFFGEDELAPGSMRYCTNVRLEWLGGQNGLRADVRTWWHRTGSADDATVDLTQFTDCAVGNEGGVSAELDSPTTVLRSVMGTTVVRRNRP